MEVFPTWEPRSQIQQNLMLQRQNVQVLRMGP